MCIVENQKHRILFQVEKEIQVVAPSYSMWEDPFTKSNGKPLISFPKVDFKDSATQHQKVSQNQMSSLSNESLKFSRFQQLFNLYATLFPLIIENFTLIGHRVCLKIFLVSTERENFTSQRAFAREIFLASSNTGVLVPFI